MDIRVDTATICSRVEHSLGEVNEKVGFFLNRLYVCEYNCIYVSYAEAFSEGFFPGPGVHVLRMQTSALQQTWLPWSWGHKGDTWIVVWLLGPEFSSSWWCSQRVLITTEASLQPPDLFLRKTDSERMQGRLTVFIIISNPIWQETAVQTRGHLDVLTAWQVFFKL